MAPCSRDEELHRQLLILYSCSGGPFYPSRRRYLALEIIRRYGWLAMELEFPWNVREPDLRGGRSHMV
jgi:hypothetical protein